MSKAWLTLFHDIRKYKLAIVFVALIGIVDFMVFPIRFFFSELEYIILYLVSYLIISYLVLYAIISKASDQRNLHGIARMFLIWLVILSIPVYYKNFSFYLCSSVYPPPIQMGRAVPAFENILVEKHKIARISDKPLRYVTKTSSDFTEIMAHNGFYKHDQLGSLWIFKKKNNQLTINVSNEIYMHSFQLWTFHNADTNIHTMDK